jgi:hypothetical protein
VLRDQALVRVAQETVSTRPTATPIPGRYEGVAVTVEVPVLNGGLFAARHTAAELSAREADQELRDVQEGGRATFGWRGQMPTPPFSAST